MKRHLIATAAVIVIGVATMGTQSAQATWRSRECRYARLDGHGGWTTHEVARTIRCAVRQMPVAGGVRNALCVARRESGLRPRAKNPTSSASGVYQIVAGTWNGWVTHFRRWYRRRALRGGVFNARTNVMIAIHSAHSWGWGPWSGGC